MADKQSGAVAYLTESASGVPYAMVFFGKQAKPAFVHQVKVGDIFTTCWGYTSRSTRCGAPRHGARAIRSPGRTALGWGH